MGVVLVGAFMVILDTTIVNVALEDIGGALGVTSGLDWVVTAYLLAVAVAQPATGWLTDRFGYKNVFTASLGAFGVASLLIAVAPNLALVVLFRVLQGLGGGAMMPVGLTMVHQLFPPDRRGRALGIWGIAAMAAPAIGPVLGGYLVTSVGWRAVFLVNVPLGVVGVIAARKLLREMGTRRDTRLDLRGLVLASTGLTLLLVALSEATPPPWRSLPMAALAVVGVASLVAFVHRTRRVAHPLIVLSIFRVRAFSVTLGILWLLILAQFARLVLIPLELQTIRGMTAFEVGLLLAPAAVGAAVTMPIGGWLSDHIGSKVPVAVGAAIVSVSTWQLAHLTPTTSLTLLTVVMVGQGLGFGLAMMPSTAVAMNAVPSRVVSQAAAVRSLNRQVAGAIGVALLATVVDASIGSFAARGVDPLVAQAAYNQAYLLAFAGAVAAFALAFFLPGRAGNQAIQRARAAEAHLPT